MQAKRQTRRGWQAGLAVGAMVGLCGILGVLQYRWIGEVSVAERERLQRGLQGSLARVSQDFSEEISVLCRTMVRGEDSGHVGRLIAWQESGRHVGMLRDAFIARPEAGEMRLERLNPRTRAVEAVPWPKEWEGMRGRMMDRVAGERGRGGVVDRGELSLIDLPRFRRDRGEPRGPGPREQDWVLLDMDAQFLATILVPELLARHLGEPAAAEYRYSVSARRDAARLIAGDLLTEPDAQVALFEPQFEAIFGGRGGGPPGRRNAASAEGRWTLAVRNQAGSLEAVVDRTRWRNLAVMAGVLALILATAWTLVYTTRQSQRLAEMQIDFVAGVSHELRTPLTVICTAAYNLRGKIAANPAQVERYGVLIQQESEKLTALVEQVLLYASSRVGQNLPASEEPVAVESLLESSLASSASVVSEAGCRVETNIASNLPLLLGDAASLERAIKNLIANAAKYGAEGDGWIGVSAETNADGAVEIRVADHGGGIPIDEQPHVFDAFFRGRQALQQQIHGTGLGLNLVKGIIEAHGGTVTVKSGSGGGAEFLIRLPAAPAEYQDECTHTIDRG